MKIFSRALSGLAMGAWLFLLPSASASSPHFWRVTSPDHEQTFAYGSEQNRAWAERGRDRHLAVLLNFTNDPFVDSDNPRQHDNFVFAFPHVRMGKDGRTFYYRTPGGHSIPVARKGPDFLGVSEVQLLPNVSLIVEKPHGYLSLTLILEDYEIASDSR